MASSAGNDSLPRMLRIIIINFQAEQKKKIFSLEGVHSVPVQLKSESFNQWHMVHCFRT